LTLNLAHHRGFIWLLTIRRDVMILKLIVCLFAAFALAGCCMSGNGCDAPLPGAPVAWDGLGAPPNEDTWATERKPKRQAKTDAATRLHHDATATSDANPLSTRERWALQEAAERAAEGALAKKLIICRGCSSPPARNDETTGNIPR
jgi:hypothetical protein